MVNLLVKFIAWWIQNGVSRSGVNSNPGIPKRIQSRIARKWVNHFTPFWWCPNITRSIPKNNFFGKNTNAYKQDGYSSVGEEERSHERGLWKKQSAHSGCGNTSCKRAASNHNKELIQFVILFGCNIMLLPLFIRKFVRILVPKIIKNQPVIEKSSRDISDKRWNGAVLPWNQIVLCKKKCNDPSQQRPKHPLLVVKDCALFVCGFKVHLFVPFPSYFLTKIIFNHRAKRENTQKNCACIIFNNNHIKEILS